MSRDQLQGLVDEGVVKLIMDGMSRTHIFVLKPLKTKNSTKLPKSYLCPCKVLSVKMIRERVDDTICQGSINQLQNVIGVAE